MVVRKLLRLDQRNRGLCGEGEQAQWGALGRLCVRILIEERNVRDELGRWGRGQLGLAGPSQLGLVLVLYFLMTVLIERGGTSVRVALELRHVLKIAEGGGRREGEVCVFAEKRDPGYGEWV